MPFHFDCKGGKVHSVKNVHLAMWGKSISEYIKSDSIIGYRLLCKNMSLTYDSENAVDIFLEGTEEFLGITETIPLNLLFRKRGKDLYLFILSRVDLKADIPQDLLINLTST